MSNDYEQWIRPIEGQMIHSIWRIVRDADDADDAMQAALETVWKRLPKVRRHPNPHALVLRICANAAYDLLRRRARRGWAVNAETRSDAVVDRSPSPRETLHEEEQMTALFGAIARLTRSQGVAVLMRFVQEQSYTDIAEALDAAKAPPGSTSTGGASGCTIFCPISHPPTQWRSLHERPSRTPHQD